MRGTEFSDYCDTARRLKISEQFQQVMDLTLKLITALTLIVEAVGAVTGPGEIVIVIYAEFTRQGLADTLNFLWNLVNKVIAGNKPVVLKQINITPSEPINLFLPGEPPDSSSERAIQVQSTWSSDLELIGYPIDELFNGLSDINDMLELLNITGIPELPVKELKPYEVNVALTPGTDFTLESYTPAVVEVNKPNVGDVSAVEDGAGAIKVMVNLYGIPATVLGPEVSPYFDGEQYVKALSVRVKEPGPTIELIEPQDPIWMPGESITVWVKATDGVPGGKATLSAIHYKVEGAATAKEVRLYSPSVDEITTFFPTIETPPEILNEDDAWILITVTAYDTLGREATVQKLIRSPLGLVKFVRPQSEDETYYSLPASWPPGNFQMVMFVKQMTTAETAVDMSTFKISFGDSPVRIMDPYEFVDYVDKVKNDLPLPDVAPRPGDYYFIPDRDLFQKGTPNILIEPGDAMPGGQGTWMVTVTFDGPWEGAPRPVERAGALIYFARYSISFKDNLGNYYEGTGPKFYLNMKNCILSKL
jgi:hypothetical protein